MKTVDLLGHTHEIVLCTDEDVKDHFSMISQYIPEEDIEGFELRMHECIKAGTAYTLQDHSCFLYYLNYKPCCADGVALFGKNVPLKIIALLAGIFTQHDKVTFKIDFHLHAGKMIQEYRSIITETSMKRVMTANHPLVVRVDELKKKISRIYNNRGLK